ncbi:DnaJ-class molecular chaperone [Rhizobium petrolearium]|uniref:DnaJ C-terminal domain-containing protein n=1 Tax=Neorhizobium petrolearium TaxID=515361 RepID=UPI001AEAEE1A|nr:DnaJ C-terminal domain-containing protein [Neorhizobium petrolearium]MBP1842407.1 DnaJ-class molecular chaperone [Neorhizobium petrolearium]
MRDPYSVLGVKHNADATEIKSAWRSKAKTLHPDHNQDDPSAASRFAEIGQAYEVLKDPERRKRYDHAAEMQQTILQQRQAAQEAAERAKAAKANAEKIMEELARANAQRAQSQAQSSQDRPQNQSGSAGETPEEVIERIFGAAAADQARAQGQAKGSAQAAGDTAETAKVDPNGEKPPLPVMAVDLIASLVRRIRGTSPAPEKAPDFSVDAIVTVEDLLNQSWVTVKLSDEREVRFALEKGMTEGQMVRLKGQGIKLAGMKPGDLLVTLKVAHDTAFRIEGFDLHTVLPISLEDAVLGAEATVETPEGNHSITIPAWSGSDQAIRLSGLGLYNEAGDRGDLVVELRIILWEKPNEKVTDLMRHMRHGLYV